MAEEHKITLTVNGESKSVAAQISVASLVESLSVAPEGRGIAVAVDSEVVPRSEWALFQLHAGAQVEILRAIQGG